MSNPSFISIYDNIITEDECKSIIKEFEDSEKFHKEGKTNNQVREDIKKSTDLGFNITDNTLTSNIICSALSKGIKKYKETSPTVDFIIDPWRCTSKYNVQKYNPNEGFFMEHCETGGLKTAHRVLVWMFYLNTLKEGGTVFPHYNLVTDAVQGRLVIWPPYWTHIHKGQISKTEIKYIATGWFEFDPTQKSIE